jgi:hypothetical protein
MKNTDTGFGMNHMTVIPTNFDEEDKNTDEC